MIKTIIFDCYGTLIGTGNGSISATKQILESNNCLIKSEEFYRLVSSNYGNTLYN
jgi:beta-phosphoglucomutase-like phosphatase (HAD superfamily)